MPTSFSLAYLAVLVCCTLLAIRMWYARRNAPVEPAEKRIFIRFVLGITVFWLVAVLGFLGGYFSWSG